MKKLGVFSLFAVATFAVSCAGPKSYDVELYRTKMDFHENFKIMQLADLHLGVQGDTLKHLDFIQYQIEQANPDLIVLTGDQFMLANTNIVNALFERLNRVCDSLSNKNEHITKFAMTYGNHDLEGDYHRYYINNVIKKFVTADGKEKEHKKYAAFIDFDDDDLFGFTNYHIDLVDPTNREDVKYRLTILDSNANHYSGFTYGYDVIHDEQLDHAIKIYNHYEDKEYIGLAFFHIPFEEFKTAREQYENASDPSVYGNATFGEGVSVPAYDNKSYSKLRSANIHGYFIGHDHVNFSDLILNATSSNVDDKALFSYGVKSTTMIYHDADMIGYKLINLKDVTPETFLTADYINQNIINKVDNGGWYNGK